MQNYQIKSWIKMQYICFVLTMYTSGKNLRHFHVVGLLKMKKIINSIIRYTFTEVKMDDTYINFMFMI